MDGHMLPVLQFLPVSARLPQQAGQFYQSVQSGVSQMVNLTMIDFAFPVSPPPVRTDIVLVYVGGDTPHPMTDNEMHAQPARFRLPTWVRSNPSGAAQAQSDASQFISWLQSHNVPKDVTVLLDLEIAVNATYVITFNNALAAAGYKVMKYGSLDYIFKNPQTHGGTFVADPTGKPHMVTTGDTVATQYEFAGSYDLSEVLPSVPLWDTAPVPHEPAFPEPQVRHALDLRITWPPVVGATNGYHYQVTNKASGAVIANATTYQTAVEVTDLTPGMRVGYAVAVHETATHLASRWSPEVVITVP
jgi:hypothetical protein